MTQNVLLTGVSGGLGLAICERLLEKGHQVFGISRSLSDNFQELQSKFPGLLHWQSIDLAETASIRQKLAASFQRAPPYTLSSTMLLSDTTI